MLLAQQEVKIVNETPKEGTFGNQSDQLRARTGAVGTNFSSFRGVVLIWEKNRCPKACQKVSFLCSSYRQNVNSLGLVCPFINHLKPMFKDLPQFSEEMPTMPFQTNLSYRKPFPQNHLIRSPLCPPFPSFASDKSSKGHRKT